MGCNELPLHEFQIFEGPTVKPRSLGVQAFLYRLLDLIEAVVLLPVEVAALTAHQVKQAYYDGMPAAWKERFVNSGASITQLTTSQVVGYFRQQEKQAVKKHMENKMALFFLIRKLFSHCPPPSYNGPRQRQVWHCTVWSQRHHTVHVRLPT
jgi:hypothetical protein